MKEELARWNDPEKVLPQKMKEVLLKISFEYDATIYRVGWLLDNGGFTMQSLVHGYCEIVGWRDIHE